MDNLMPDYASIYESGSDDDQEYVDEDEEGVEEVPVEKAGEPREFVSNSIDTQSQLQQSNHRDYALGEGDKLEGNYRMIMKQTLDIKLGGLDVYCIRYSPCGSFLAVGYSNGSIKILNASDMKLAFTFPPKCLSPITAIRWRPINEKTRNVLIASNALGQIFQWHATSSKCLNEYTEDGNEIYAIDYNPDGSRFATGGKDTSIRVYDDVTKSIIACIKGKYGDSTYSIFTQFGHSNRIFSTKFFPGDDNLLVSGGWDNTIQIWDIRANSAVRSMYGPHVCGDSIDIFGHELLTGSWRSENQLQLWDIGTGAVIQTVAWGTSQCSSSHTSSSCMLYSAQFSKASTSGRFIAAGGSDPNELKIFDKEDNYKPLGYVYDLEAGVYSIDFSPFENDLAIAGGLGPIQIVSIVDIS